jgi:hypothetical protein
VALDMSEVENAKRQLDLLTGITGETAYTALIKLALDAGTMTGAGAQALVQAELADAGVTIPGELAVDTSLAAQTVAGFEAPDPPPVELTGDRSPADEVAEDFTDEKRETVPVAVDADTVTAARPCSLRWLSIDSRGSTP